MGKQCIACGISFFSPDDSDKCGKCREKIQQESHEDHGGCGCGHSHWSIFYTRLGENLTCLITISSCLLDPFQVRQGWMSHFQFAVIKFFIEKLDIAISVFPARRSLKLTLKYHHLIKKATL